MSRGRSLIAFPCWSLGDIRPVVHRASGNGELWYGGWHESTKDGERKRSCWAGGSHSLAVVKQIVTKK